MRIAYLCSDPGIPVFGNKGASIHVRELTAALQHLGHEVTVLATRLGGEPPPDYGVPVIDVAPEPVDERLVGDLAEADAAAGPAIARDLRAITAAETLHRRAVPYLRSFAPAALYERYSLFGMSGVSLARELGVPLILEVNAPLTEEQERHRGLAFVDTARERERIVLRSADRVVTVSSALARWVQAAGVPPERITVLPNAVDLARFGPPHADRDAIRTKLGLQDASVVGFVGTLKPWHDVATLVRAVAMLRAREPAVHLLVVGDGPERPRLEELARHEGIADVTTFTGSVPHHTVPGYLGAFDVAVAPYAPALNFYFSPLKLFECLAAERPVVTTDVGDIGHCITHGDTGLLYAAGDAHSLAAAIATLLADPARASTLARAGRDHVGSHHTWERNAAAIVELADHRVDRMERRHSLSRSLA